MGYIISTDVILIDHERMKVTTSIIYLNAKKAMHSFLKKIKFVFRFISLFEKIVKPFQNMIKKEAAFKWFKEEKKVFHRIK